jgi:hypothetical protein
MSNRTAFAAVAIVFSLLAVPAVARAQPFVQNVVPSQTGQTITIQGINLAPAPDVYLNFIPLTVQSSSPTQIVAALPSPPLAPGTYSLIIVVGGQFALNEAAIGGAGSLTAPPLGTATAATGFMSMGLTLAASAFNSSTATAERQTFRWRADPVSNNTINPTGRLQLLFGTGAAAPAPTGLFIDESGLVNFAAGQTFPGVITDVDAGPGLVVSGTGDVRTLSVGVITGGMIGGGQIQTSHLAFNPATQAELDAHTKHTKLTYVNPFADNSPTTTFTQLGVVGNFTKDRAASDIILMWNGTVSRLDFPFATNFCEFQLRIDGDSDGTGRARPVGEALTSVSVSAMFTGLAAGSHSVSIYSRGDAASCRVNFGIVPETIIVTESGG